MGDTIKVVKQDDIIRLQTTANVVPSVLDIQDFSLTATEADQAIFTLPEPVRTNGLFVVAIEGALQNLTKDDYKVSGTTLTFNEGLPINAKVFGQYEKA